MLLALFSFLHGCSGQKETKQVLPTENQVQISESAININTASAEELEKIPHIGTKIAQNIIEFRQNYGRFRKPEYLLLVRGMSDKRFREIRSLIKIE